MRKQKLSQRLSYSAVVSFGMALAMSGCMSFAMGWLHAGDAMSLGEWVAAWPPTWGPAFALAWPLAFGLVVVLLPRLLRLTAWLHMAGRGMSRRRCQAPSPTSPR